MSNSVYVVIEKFAKERITTAHATFPCNLEIKLSFDGEQHFIEEAWLDETIDFYAIADKYGFLDKLLEEALDQLKKDKQEALEDRAYVESFD